MSVSSTPRDLCDVYLCSAPIQNGNSAGLGLLSYVASSSQQAGGNSWEKHWLVVFDYGEDVVLVCDADMDRSGELTGRKYWKKRAAFLKEAYPCKRRLGKHRIQKARIEEVMRKMADCGQYHLTRNNCQKWAKELLRRLGIEEPRDVPRDAEDVVQEVIQHTVTATLLMGAWAVAKFILFRGRF
ncbi:hypothetical protein HPB50_001842 [Hyalomma asiaticum]|uniref:Uncharacterized protein n=1 Tax=Hyalomma asiaticum TaxID=266040 RepID=A0ACB7SBL2_HYAAI|nr:hypothetical protein HPB50_001842 [Hyalomma asiaticum]